MSVTAIVLWISLLNTEWVAENTVSDSLLFKAQAMKKDRMEDSYLLLHQYLQTEVTNDSLLHIAYRELATYFLNKRELDSCDWYTQKSLVYFQPTSKIKADLVNNRASIAFYKSDFKQALIYFLKAYSIYDSLHDLGGKSQILNNLGAVSQFTDDLDGATRYYLESIEVKTKLNDSSGLARSLNNLGLIYAKQKQFYQAIEKYQQSVAIKLKLNDQRGLSSSYHNLGIEHKNIQQYEQAITFSKRSIKIDKQLGINRNLPAAYDNLASVYFYMRKFELARNYADSALAVSFRENDAFYLKDIYQTLYKIDSASGDFVSAFRNFQAFTTIKDSLVSLEKSTAINSLKTQFETELKEQQIDLLQQENRIQQLQSVREAQFRVFLLVGLALLLISLFLIYRQSKLKSRTNAILDSKNEELGKLNQTKDQLFAIISHDLRSPLSAMQSITHSLADHWDAMDKDQIKEYIYSMRDSSSEVYELMDNLLRWALTQTGQMNYQPLNLHPQQLVEEVLRNLQTVIQLKKLHVSVESSADAEVWADPEMLKIILRNLLSNAIKFTPINKSISIKMSYSTIEIVDQGVGIKAHDLPLLFTSTTNSNSIRNSDEKGTGLGLVLCKELMDRQEGTIQVDSEWGVGTQFTLKFKQA